MSKRETITAIIPAHNEEQNIERCIKSLDWCDEVTVVWMGSDKTGRIAKNLGARVVIRNQTKGSNWQKVQENINWAIDESKTDWIIRVDADEEITRKLKDEILAVLERDSDAKNPDNFVAYGIPRNQYFFGSFLKGGDWAHDRLVRLFRRPAARYENFVRIHEQFVVEGKVGYLKGKINHYSHPTLTAAMEKFNSYTSTEIYDHHELFGKALYNMFTQPLYIFLRWMIWHQGFRDGIRGIVAGAYRAWYEFMLWSKYLEKLNTKKAK
ncbi:MAG: Glycosyl transferase family 2 [Microgenomates group bacterium GW2011_GWA2_44_7]|nr:MAG: Glycosyl transferase family 2 [Microgenomates group bacterium GW2011_GWA2_44_7]KKT78373.1 MAG: Glycosyl transferase family 2 [Microgenomates group bacterium GW2011_GWB1_44_8]